jgi:hypothetical protein
MRKDKQAMITKVVNCFSSVDLYKAIDTHGKEIIEHLVDTFRASVVKIVLNKRAVDKQLGIIFQKETEKGWTSSSGNYYIAYRPIHCFSEGVLNVMKAVFYKEAVRRTLEGLDQERATWEAIETDCEDVEFEDVVERLTTKHLRQTYGSAFTSSMRDVKQTQNLDEYIYTEMFKLLSSHLKDKNSRRFGFSFSDTLICVAPGMIGKKYGKGRAPTRHAMVHLCPKLEMPEGRLIVRPINDMSKPPAFFCKYCKERLTKAHKTFWQLTMVGRKL